MKVKGEFYWTADQQLIVKGLEELGYVFVENVNDCDIIFAGNRGGTKNCLSLHKATKKPLLNLVLDIPFHLKDVNLSSYQDSLLSSSIVFTDSEATKVQVKQLCGVEAITSYVPLDIELMETVKAQNIKKEPKLVCSLGRWTVQKMWPVAIKALSSCKGIHYILMGHGPPNNRDNYIKMAKNLGVSLEIVEEPTNEEKFRILAKSKVVVAPSMFEGLGLVPLEAAYFNTVPVVTKLPAHLETLGENYWFSFNVRDVKTCSKKIMMALQAPHLFTNPVNYELFHPRAVAKIMDRAIKERL